MANKATEAQDARRPVRGCLSKRSVLEVGSDRPVRRFTRPVVGLGRDAYPDTRRAEIRPAARTRVVRREVPAGLELERIAVPTTPRIVLAAEPHFESHAREYGGLPPERSRGR